MRSPLLELRNVGFGYASISVLTDTSFALEPGSMTALIGPNGIGKTTLLRVASGFLRPTSGEVRFEGEPLARLSPRQAARRIATVPQSLEMPFAYTVQQVVEQGRTPYLSLLGGLRPADRNSVDRALDLTRTAALRDRSYNELSGGEQQRVKIALALAQQPRLLLLDEPTQNLDIGRQMELLELLRQLRDTGVTVLASIHDLVLIDGRFSAVILLRPSAPPLYGPPSSVMERSLLASAFDCRSEDHPLFTHLAVHNAKACEQQQKHTTGASE